MEFLKETEEQDRLLKYSYGTGEFLIFSVGLCINLYKGHVRDRFLSESTSVLIIIIILCSSTINGKLGSDQYGLSSNTESLTRIIASR